MRADTFPKSVAAFFVRCVATTPDGRTLPDESCSWSIWVKRWVLPLPAPALMKVSFPVMITPPIRQAPDNRCIREAGFLSANPPPVPLSFVLRYAFKDTSNLPATLAAGATSMFREIAARDGACPHPWCDGPFGPTERKPCQLQRVARRRECNRQQRAKHLRFGAVVFHAGLPAKGAALGW